MNLIKNKEDLSLYFDDILVVNSNPYILTSSSVYKVDGEIKYSSKKEEINLYKIKGDNHLISILNDILENLNLEKVDFYPKGILKFIKGNNSNNLNKFIKNLSQNNFIITSDRLKSEIKKVTNINVYTIKELKLDDNLLIIGERNRLIVRDSQEIEVYFDKSKFKILHLV